MGASILSFAEDDKLRPGEDVTSASGMTKFRRKIRNVRHRNSAKKMADLTGGKTEQKKREHAEESKKRKEPESRTTIDMKIRTVPIHRRQLGYFVPFTFSSPKLVFPGLFLHKLTEKNTHRVFASVI